MSNKMAEYVMKAAEADEEKPLLTTEQLLLDEVASIHGQLEQLKDLYKQVHCIRGWVSFMGTVMLISLILFVLLGGCSVLSGLNYLGGLL